MDQPKTVEPLVKAETSETAKPASKSQERRFAAQGVKPAKKKADKVATRAETVLRALDKIKAHGREQRTRRGR